MSTKRKLRRAAGKQGGGKDAAALRRQTSTERFAKTGSEKLWSALLGWSGERQIRAWLMDAVHDAVRDQVPAERAVKQFATRRPDVAEKLKEADIATAIDLWREAGDEADDGTQFHYLAALCGRLGLGEPSAEELSADWRIWTSLALASGPHKLLLASLAQTEQAAIALGQITQSQPAASVMLLTRAMWSALAYGDEATLRRLKEMSEEFSPGAGR